jgi:predicted negative regulator of RcsB-dependent stress response
MNKEDNAIINFVNKYKSTITVLLIVFLTILLYLFFNSQLKTKKSEEASKLYYSWNINLLNENTTKSDENFNDLINNYPNTGYAQLALLKDSVQEYNSGNTEISLDQFTRLKNLTNGSSGNKLLNKIASINIARINIDLLNFDEAIKVLTSLPNASQDAYINELIGDIYLKQGNTSQSRAQYLSAASMYADEGNDVGQRLVNMKISNLK